MSTKLDPALSDFYEFFSRSPTPRSSDEALCLMAECLKRLGEPIRILFYLAPAPPEVEPVKLLPCPARPAGWRRRSTFMTG